MGRPPCEQLSPEFVLSRFVDFIASRHPIRHIIEGIKSRRKEEKCAYTNIELTWTTLLMFLLRFSSRNRFDQKRNSRAFSESIFNLAGRAYDKSNPELHTACTQTLVNMLRKTSESELAKAQLELARYILRGKWLNPARLNGYYCIAVDATLKDRKFSRNGKKLRASRKKRYVLEAKLITPWGWSISVMCEEIRPYSTDAEKQDSEIEGFKRMAPRLHEAMGNYGICLIGDALYACESVRNICKEYGWQYIFTAKEGRSPALFKAFMSEIKANPNQSATLFGCDKKSIWNLKWSHGEKASFSVPYNVECNFVKITETEAEADTESETESEFETVENKTWKKTYYEGSFITSFPINNEEDARRIARWGRLRWNIENSFKVMKHDDFGLEHTFCQSQSLSQKLYLMMSIAHTLWQVFYSGMLAPEGKRVRKMTQKDMAEKLREGFLYYGILEPLGKRKARLSRAYMDNWIRTAS